MDLLNKLIAEGRDRNSGRVATRPYVPVGTERIGEVTVCNHFLPVGFLISIARTFHIFSEMTQNRPIIIEYTLFCQKSV